MLYVLDKNKETRKVEQAEFESWLKSDGDMTARTVGYEMVGSTAISTVFLCVNQSNGRGKPMLFETAIMKNGFVDLFESYSSWEEAESEHRRAVEKEQGSKTLLAWQ